MRTKLVFFGNMRDSIEGTKRAFTGGIVMILLNVIWYTLMKSFYEKRGVDMKNGKRILGVFIALSVILSVVSLQLPEKLSEVLLFSAGVGFCMYLFANVMIMTVKKDWDLSMIMVDTFFGTVSSVITATFIYYVFWNVEGEYSGE
jgi:uncharacterized membrane protein